MTEANLFGILAQAQARARKYQPQELILERIVCPALADVKRDTQEFKPLWEQEARDEQGRRRFHGAFTGGFSAGYFNTVGSKEGWTPSTFKSTRNNRATKVQRPEDFMDDEDIELMKQDRKLENTETFRSAPLLGGVLGKPSGSSLTSALESLIVPAKTSIGASLLQKLGWRPGQGIGPRVTLRKLRIQEGKLGRTRLGVDEEDENDGEGGEERDDGGGEASKHTYAPRDTTLLVYDAKDNREGLGFEKGRGMGRLPFWQGRGFGTSAPDDEDGDPYAVEPNSAPQYVFDTNDDDDVIVMGSAQPPPLSDSQPQSLYDPRRNDVDTWHDGRPVLVGFVLDPKGVPPDKWFAFPKVPADWRPRPARVWGTRRKFDDQVVQEEKEVVRGEPGKPLTHEQRGQALGEQTRVSTAKSVFEYMSEKDRERMASLSAAAKEKPRTPLSFELEPELPPERATEVVIPPLSPRTASAALKGFIPYGDDLAKQDRYRSYLISQTYNTKHPNPTLLASTSIEEVNKELEGFAASARIFKPMSLAMSNRFTSGSASLATSDMKQAKPGLHLFDQSKAPPVEFTRAQEEQKEKEREEAEAKKLTPREQAAKNGMFGKLTREVKEFYPVKLVCKRFHVADPHPEGPPGGVGRNQPSKSGSRANLEEMTLPLNDASWESSFVHQSGTDQENVMPLAKMVEAGIERQPKSIAEVGMGDDVNQGRDTLTYTKPSIDIFKAIFASDDDEDDDDEDDDGDRKKKKKDEGGAVVKREEKLRDEDPFPVRYEPVDYKTFKPVFNNRKRTTDDGDKERERERDRERDRDKDMENGGEGKEKKRKKENKKDKRRKGVLSFDIEADGGDGDETSRKQKKDGDGDEKRRKKRDDRQQGEGEGEWVEKSVASIGDDHMLLTPVTMVSNPSWGPRGRKGAADFM